MHARPVQRRQRALDAHTFGLMRAAGWFSRKRPPLRCIRIKTDGTAVPRTKGQRRKVGKALKPSGPEPLPPDVLSAAFTAFAVSIECNPSLRENRRKIIKLLDVPAVPRCGHSCLAANIRLPDLWFIHNHHRQILTQRTYSGTPTCRYAQIDGRIFCIYASQAVSVIKLHGFLSSSAVWRIAVSSSTGNIHSIRSSCAATVCGDPTVVTIEK
jgi:hypothetical protein